VGAQRREERRPRPPGPLLWTSGDYVGSAQDERVEIQVVEYRPESSELTVSVNFEEPPKPGDQFVVDFGRTLIHGQQAYREHCIHCHGTSGDGKGPTAEYLKPYPRDYRLAKFKFTSTSRDSRPSRDDLHRTVRQGIPGTYMPSFLLLDDDELDAIVEYVRWLSMRGEYEQKMIAEFETDFSEKAVESQVNNAKLLYAGQLAAWEQSKQGEKPEEPNASAIRKELDEDLQSALESFPETADELATEVAQAWSNAELPESVILPSQPRAVTRESSPDQWQQSLANGRKYYVENCSNCHGPSGRGDGAQTFAFQKIPGTDEEYPEPGLYDDWGNRIDPRNLTRGVYRGGRRPLDLYRRVHQGIPGTPMPPFNSKLTDPQIWDLVNYVMNLPYEHSAPEAAPEPGSPRPIEAEKVRVGQLDR
jgi:mono/diheme cytochrome c family protein